jgi:ABC-type uncharacterized transport system substrate-binding protein
MHKCKESVKTVWKDMEHKMADTGLYTAIWNDDKKIENGSRTKTYVIREKNYEKHMNFSLNISTMSRYSAITKT